MRLNISHSGRPNVLVAALLGGTLLAGGVGVGLGIAQATNNTPPPLSLPHTGKQSGFADLVATVKPAVVNISTTENVKPQQGLPFDQNGPMGEMLRQFFGQHSQQLFQQQARPVHALGSGFLIDPDGTIVTNNHVIDDATEVDVTLADGSIHHARIVGRDAKTDLAVLKIGTSHPLPYVAFGNSDDERVGDWVIAVGNPYGLGGSVTAGIVSASNRDIDAGPYDDFLQIDAPINPGNSGGPLFNQSGQVIGIDTAIYSPSGGSVGIGFAIPSNVIRQVVAQLRAHGRVERGWLGVAMQPITPALAKALGLQATDGVLVATVTPDSPAARGGVAQGDVITAFNGKPINSPRDLAFAVADTRSGESADMIVRRQGREKRLEVTIGTEHAQKVAAAQPQSEHGRLGLELGPLSQDQRDSLGGGAVVESVAPGSPADQSGLEPGDVIQKIGEHAVNSPGDAVQELRKAENDNRASLPILVQRNGTNAYLALQLTPGTG